MQYSTAFSDAILALACLACAIAIGKARKPVHSDCRGVNHGRHYGFRAQSRCIEIDAAAPIAKTGITQVLIESSLGHVQRVLA